MRHIEAGNFDSADFSAPGVDIQPEFLGSSPQVNTPRTPGILTRSLLAAAGIAATFGVACGGGDEEGASATIVMNTPTSEIASVSTEVPKSTNTPNPTEAPKPTATEKKVEPMVDDVSIKTGLAGVYEGVKIPPGSCSADKINALIDEIYTIYSTNPNKFSLTGGLASVYAELVVLAESQDNEKAQDLAKSIRAGVELLIEQHLQERGLPSTNKPEVISSWESNVDRKIEAIKDGSGCDIVVKNK